MATHLSKGPCTAIEPRTAKTNFTQVYVSKERWTKSRWKPTVMPRVVTKYMPRSRPRSVQ